MAPVRPGMARRWPFPGDVASSSDGQHDDLVNYPKESPMTRSPFDAMPVTRPEAIAPDTFLIPNLAPGRRRCSCRSTRWSSAAPSRSSSTPAPRCTASCGSRRCSRWSSPRTCAGSSCPTTTATTPAACSTCSSAARTPRSSPTSSPSSASRWRSRALPLERMRWIEPGGSFDAGDRVLHLFKPPIFDGPTTRGLYDPKTAAMWIVDSLRLLHAGLAPCGDLPRDSGDSMPR